VNLGEESVIVWWVPRIIMAGGMIMCGWILIFLGRLARTGKYGRDDAAGRRRPAPRTPTRGDDMGLGDLKSKASEALSSDKVEQVSDQALDRVAKTAKKVTGGKFDEKIDSVRDAADAKIGNA